MEKDINEIAGFVVPDLADVLDLDIPKKVDLPFDIDMPTGFGVAEEVSQEDTQDKDLSGYFVFQEDQEKVVTPVVTGVTLEEVSGKEPVVLTEEEIQAMLPTNPVFGGGLADLKPSSDSEKIIPEEPQVEKENPLIKSKENFGVVEPYMVCGNNTFSSYMENMLRVDRKVPTGIPELNSVLGGGYPLGLSMFGGIPNCGKTTLMVQSALNLSRQKEPVPSLFLTLDMSRDELIDKIFSQVSYEIFGAEGYTLKDISDRKLVVDSEHNFNLKLKVMTDTKYMTIIDLLDSQSISSILGEGVYGEDAFCKLIELYYQTYNKLVVFVDNLQELTAYLSYGEGKVGVDKSMTLLKNISRRLEIPIVLISTLGRAYYDKPISLNSFKETGNIDYGISCGFGIEPKFITEGSKNITIDDFREQEQREVVLKNIKGRDSGFKKETFILNAKYCRFESIEEASTVGKANIQTRKHKEYMQKQEEYDKEHEGFTFTDE